jgi:hypothetical protein
VKHCSAVVYKKDLKCFVCVLNGEIKALSAKIEKKPGSGHPGCRADYRNGQNAKFDFLEVEKLEGSTASMRRSGGKFGFIN